MKFKYVRRKVEHQDSCGWAECCEEQKEDKNGVFLLDEKEIERLDEENKECVFVYTLGEKKFGSKWIVDRFVDVDEMKGMLLAKQYRLLNNDEKERNR
jgi:hypothetical protein